MAGMQSLVNGQWMAYDSPQAVQYRRELMAGVEAKKRAEQAQQQGTIQQLMQTADPFAGQRAGYGKQLSDLMTNPTAALESNPFLKASAEQGMEAASRKLNQMGMGTSGNAALELQKAAQANMSQDFFKLSDLLGGFAGANANPAAAAQVGLQGLNYFEEGRRFNEGRDKFRSFVGGTETTPKSSPMTLGSYWGR